MTNDAPTTADAVRQTWDPRQYERFKAERSRPFGDLVDLVERTAAPRVVDLGCGTGELTATLADRLGSDDVLGIDLAPAMLADAAAFANDRVRFASGDIATWVDEWTKGTTLNGFKALLSDERYAAFIDRYRQRLLSELGDRAPYFYPFRRVLLWGRLARPCSRSRYRSSGRGGQDQLAFDLAIQDPLMGVGRRGKRHDLDGDA